MPKLLLFAPFQNVVVDREENSIFFFSLLEGILALLGDDGEPQETDVAVPWTAVAIWLRTTGDEEQCFEQRVEVITPRGVIRGPFDMSFVMVNRTVRNILKVTGFPVGGVGEHVVRLSYRRSDATDPWIVASEFPVAVIRPPEQTAQAGATE